MAWWLAQNTITAAVLTAVVALLCRLGRFSPAVRHALWLVVLIKLFTPPLIAWPWQLPDVGRVFPPQLVTHAELPGGQDRPFASDGEAETILALAELQSNGSAAMPSFVDVGGKAGPVGAEEVGNRMAPAWLLSAALDLWIAGTAAMCLLQLARIVRFRRLLGRGQSAPRWLAKQVDKLADRLRVRRPATLIVPGIRSPFVWHMGRAKLLWPALLTERQPLDRRRSVIVHELAHLRRRDHWVGWLQMLAECVWWWNPLFWYIRRQLRLNAELACDAWVVSVLPEDRRAYAEALIEVTQLVSQTAAPLPALGMSSGARHEFERRLTMIMRDRVPCKVPVLGLVAVGILALVALPGWSQVDPPKNGEPKKEAEPAVSVPVEMAVEYLLAVLDDETILQEANPTPAADSDRDKKLQEVEQKLQALLKEVQALRAGGSPAPKASRLWLRDLKPSGEQPKTRTRVSTQPDGGSGRPAFRILELEAPQTTVGEGARVYTVIPAQVQNLVGEVKTVRDGQTVVNLIALSRATYKLPKNKAEALARFLQEHGKVQVLETKVDGDSLIVTTTPEAQKAIGQFVGIIQGLTAMTLDPKTGKVVESKPAVLWKALREPAQGEALQFFWNEAARKAKPDQPKDDKPKE